MIEIDARGLACPQPVILAKKAIDGMTEGEVIAIVDNTTAKENISRLAENMNCKYEISDRDNCFHIKIKKTARERMPEKKEDNTVIVIASDRFGQGSEELGNILMKSYIYALTETTPTPKTIIFLNSGVKLTVEGSPVLENIKNLESLGIEVISCGTCLDYYQIKDKLGAGIAGNMYSIVEKMNSSGKIINIG